MAGPPHPLELEAQLTSQTLLAPVAMPPASTSKFSSAGIGEGPARGQALGGAGGTRMWVTHGPGFRTRPLYLGTWSDAAMTCPEGYGDSREGETDSNRWKGEELQRARIPTSTYIASSLKGKTPRPMSELLRGAWALWLHDELS